MAFSPESAPQGRAARLWRVVLSLSETPPSAEDGALRPAVPGHAENLVFEFDEAYTDFVDGLKKLPSESQMRALQAVDLKVSSMVGAKDAALWTDRARREDEHWGELRQLAARVLSAFDWTAHEE